MVADPVDIATMADKVGSEASSSSNDKKDHAGENTIRPIHQNWWPVASLGSLDPTRPNAVELLNQKLVLFQSNSTTKSTAQGPTKNTNVNEVDLSQGWTCLDDRCSHRFAPLSEGRIVSVQHAGEEEETTSHNAGCKTCRAAIQCAYHGWEFDSAGNCIHVPQLQVVPGDNEPSSTTAPTTKKKKNPSRRGSVEAYPVRVHAGMVFVWADPPSYETIGRHVEVVVPDIAQAAYDTKGDIVIFQRDLPYGYELLGENLLDLSHLPFSHHSVGGLKREFAGPLPFVMLSDQFKSPDGPLYEVDLPNAADFDPTFLGIKDMRGPTAVHPNATLRVGFYQPNHVRYTRTLVPGNPATATYVILYLCPTGSAKSRVFLVNVFGVPPPKKTDGGNGSGADQGTAVVPYVNEITKPKTTLRSRLTNLKSSLSNLPRNTKQHLQRTFMKLYLARNPTLGHELSHQIFDGDGVFLNKQGDRMQRKGLTYRDYDTPTPADVLVNAFRRYLTVAATKTVTGSSSVPTAITTAGSNNLRDIAQAALPFICDFGDGVVTRRPYEDNLPRSVLLDRYDSHTKNCPVCREALESGQRTERRLQTLQTVMTGAIGASASVTTMFAVGASVTAAPFLLPMTGISGVTTTVLTGVAVLTSTAKKNVKEKNQRLLFEDWVHAEKD
jgi:pheophorbide a oxygenase